MSKRLVYGPVLDVAAWRSHDLDCCFTQTVDDGVNAMMWELYDEGELLPAALQSLGETYAEVWSGASAALYHALYPPGYYDEAGELVVDAAFPRMLGVFSGFEVD